MTIMTKEELNALQERQKQVEEELAWIKRQVMTATSEAADYYSVKEATTTASTCDCAAVPLRQQQQQQPMQACRPVPYGSTDEASPLLEQGKMKKNNGPSSKDDTEESPPPEHIMLFGTSGDHHEWEECFSHVRSEEDLENEKVHNESEFYLHSSMFARGTCVQNARVRNVTFTKCASTSLISVQT